MANTPTFIDSFGVFNSPVIFGKGDLPLTFQTSSNQSGFVISNAPFPTKTPVCIIVSSMNPFFQAGGSSGGGDLPNITRGQGFPLGDGNF